MKKNDYVILTQEQLRRIVGGRQVSVDELMADSPLVADRKAALKHAQTKVVNAAIYQRGARGTYDNRGATSNTTWCNQASFDVMEATGVHMEAFYGKNGTREQGDNVRANAACDNVARYIQDWTNEYVDMALANGSNLSRSELIEQTKRACPIQELTPEQAQQKANEGYTVVAMWRSSDDDTPGHVTTVASGNRFTSRNNIKVSNVGLKNELDMTIKDAFGLSAHPDRDVKFYVDTQQTFTPNPGFTRGIAYDNVTGKQSISVNDPTYNKGNYDAYKVRQASENLFTTNLKTEIRELAANAKGMSDDLNALTDAQVGSLSDSVVEAKLAAIRKGLQRGESLAGLIHANQANGLVSDLRDLQKLHSSLLAEQQRLEQEASTTTTTNTTPTEVTVATETSNEQEQSQTQTDQTSEDGTSGDTQNQTGGGSTDEQGSGNGETSNNQTQNDGGSGGQSNTTDETEDETTYWDTFEDEEEETETTETPTEDEGGSGEIVLEGENEITEGGEGSSDESPIIVGGTTGGSSGGNTGNNQGGSGSGSSSPETEGGSGGGGSGPRYETEMPDAWATSITPNKPDLPEGMYLGRHAGINARNYYFDWLGDSEETSITRIFDENTFESDYFEAGGVSTSESSQQIKLVSSVALSGMPSELEECDMHG